MYIYLLHKPELQPAHVLLPSSLTVQNSVGQLFDGHPANENLFIINKKFHKVLWY